jgi:putative inorganic carbon (hco3(-)) transporter
MRTRSANPSVLAIALVGVATLGLLVGVGIFLHESYLSPGLAGAGTVIVVCVAAAFAYFAWSTPPAWLITGAIMLSPFNSNWALFGFPAGFAPDRFLLAAGILGLILRTPPVRARPRLVATPLHALFAATVLWAIGSGIAAQTITDKDSVFFVIDRLIVPFVVFALAPYAFRDARDRTVLLGGLTVLGAYVGLTTLFETVGPHALVFPNFILDPSVGFHLRFGERARGPFLEAGVNGMGLYVFAVAAAIGARTFERRWTRLAAAVVLGVCALGILFTLTRAVWLATVVATVLTMLFAAELRRWLIPAVVGVTALSGLALVVVPGLRDKVSARETAERSVWERRDVDTAALTMVQERPLIGFGLNSFNEENADYFRLLPNTPQVAERRIAIHNVFLLFATELGLVGVTLFLTSLGIAVGSALTSRGPPEMRPWRTGLVAITLFWLVEANFAPLGHVFPDMIVWLWAGVVLAGAAAPAGESDRETAPA